MSLSRPGLASVSLVAAVAMAAAGCAVAASTDQVQGEIAAPMAPSAATAAEPALQQVDGTLRHVFSVPFTADYSMLVTIRGLVAQRVARTATGGELEVTFPPGVPYPEGAGSVIVREVPDPNYRSIFDLLALPPEISVRYGRALLTSHRIASRPAQYLIAWRDRNTGEHVITLSDASKPNATEPVIARTRAAILGVAHSPSTFAADYYVTVWTMANMDGGSEGVGQAMVESYVWRPPDS